MPPKCWESVTRRGSTRCGNSTWTRRGRGEQLPQLPWRCRLRRQERGTTSATSRRCAIRVTAFLEGSAGDSRYPPPVGDEGMTERRTTRRYDLTLPVIIRVPAERALDLRQGRTRDISTRGLYFVVDQNMESGSQLDITLTLPAEITHGSEVFVRAAGKVVRVERRTEDGSERMGVAAVIERYDIIRGEAARA